MATSPTPASAAEVFARQLSTESGRDNPFRPDGDISKEADEIVRLIQSGRSLLSPAGDEPLDSINTTQNSVILQSDDVHVDSTDATPASPDHLIPVQTTPLESKSKGANGSAGEPPTVEILHGTVPISSAPAEVERVTLKKNKGKCACCVLM